MKIGLYSFTTLELNQVEKLKLKIDSLMRCKCEIYIYSENTQKERLSKRDGLRQLLEDYRKSKIDIIVFENRESLGKDEYTTYRIIKILSDENVNFTSLKEEFNNSSVGKMQIEIMGFFEKYTKERLDERSKMTQKIKDRKNTNCRKNK